jgi:hypothetical protein
VTFPAALDLRRSKIGPAVPIGKQILGLPNVQGLRDRS